MRAVLLAALLGVAVAIPAQAERRPPAPRSDDAAPRVAIVVEVAVGVDAERAQTIAAALAAGLSAQLVVDARGGAPVDARLPSGGLVDGCLARPSCVIDVATRLEVDELLFIALVQLGDELQIDASWIDASGAHGASRPRIRIGPGDDADAVFRARAVTLLPEARLRPAIAPPRPAPPPPSRRGRHLTPTTWTLAAVAAVGLGAGTAFGLSTRSAYLACERDGCDDARRDTVRTRGLVADASFGVAALAAIAGAVLYLRSSPTEARVGVQPVAGGAGAALVVGGRF